MPRGTGTERAFGSTPGAIAIDSTLQHVAWLDSQGNDDLQIRPFELVAPLAEPSKGPIRHWFDDLLRQARLGDLSDLAKFLEWASERGELSEISPQLLRHWASSQFLISVESAGALLKALEEKVSPDREFYRLLFARLLTFLTEAVRCFAAEPVSEEAARAAIFGRLSDLNSRKRAA